MRKVKRLWEDKIDDVCELYSLNIITYDNAFKELERLFSDKSYISDFLDSILELKYITLSR